MYIRVKDRTETKEYNSMVNDNNYYIFREWVDDYLSNTYCYSFGKKEKDGYHLTCSSCGSEMVTKKANGNVCSCCGRQMKYKKSIWLEDEDWLSFIDENEKYYITRTYYIKQKIYNWGKKELYIDEVKREFYNKETGDVDFACSKGMHYFYSTILYRKKYDEWIPTCKYLYERVAGSNEMNSIFCPLLIPNFKEELKYCGFKEAVDNEWYTNLPQHLNLYKSNKEIELICKTKWQNAYWKFSDISQVMDFNNKRLLKLCIKYNANENEVKILKKYPDIPYETLKAISEGGRILVDICFAIGYKNILKVKKLYSNELYFYRDYIEALNKLNVPINKDNMFPKNLIEAHDRTIARVRIVENKKLDKEIKKYAKELKLELKSKKYELLLPTSSKDIIVEGEQQHNCVGKMGYIEKMAKRETIICFLRKKEDIKKSYVTIELAPDRKKIRQAYLHHNNVCPENIMKVIKKQLLIA